MPDSIMPHIPPMPMFTHADSVLNLVHRFAKGARYALLCDHAQTPLHIVTERDLMDYMVTLLNDTPQGKACKAHCVGLSY